MIWSSGMSPPPLAVMLLAAAMAVAALAVRLESTVKGWESPMSL